MKFSIYTKQLEGGAWMSRVDNTKHDGLINKHSPILHGKTEQIAYGLLEEILIDAGHEVIPKSE